MERCEVCGFAWDEVAPTEVVAGIRADTAAAADLLEAHAGRATARPDEATWSPLEYACHVRDVLANLRDRIVMALVVDEPAPHPLFGTPRVDLGLYRLDVPARTAEELVCASEVFARTLECLPEGGGRRTLAYAWPRPAVRTVDWVAAQAFHECRHHLDDIRTGLGPAPVD